MMTSSALSSNYPCWLKTGKYIQTNKQTNKQNMHQVGSRNALQLNVGTFKNYLNYSITFSMASALSSTCVDSHECTSNKQKLA